MGIRIQRLLDRPIISQESHPDLGENIQGPSLIRAPDWLERPFGKYYLYFADHKGRRINLAYADHLVGPWTVHPAGSLKLENSHFLTEPPVVTAQQLAGFEKRVKALGIEFSHDLQKELTTPHIASPDVHVNSARRLVVMYYHGLDAPGVQFTRVAISRDGLEFHGQPQNLGPSYFRVFEHDDAFYALAMPGVLLRSENGLTNFERGPTLFNSNQRHTAVLKRGNRLYVFWTQVGDAPENILLSCIDLSGDWRSWKEGATVEVLRPERSWEGADAPIERSVRSSAYGIVNQLRDPAVFEEDERIYLLYAVAGESGIAIAEVNFDDASRGDSLAL